MKKLLNWLLPPTCVLCGDPSQQNIDLCAPCQHDLPQLGASCARCALPLPATSSSDIICGECLRQPPPFDRILAIWRYQSPVDRLITMLKFNHQLVYARLLGELLAEQLQRYYQNHVLPECIIPVPLHKQRLRERGFNQALEIARPIAKQLRVAIDRKSCARTRATEAQTALPANQRRRNVKGAFAITGTLRAKHVAVLDDVITTGHTVTELSHALRDHGVEHIDIWCCARTPF
jgi:ComF family protein